MAGLWFANHASMIVINIFLRFSFSVACLIFGSRLEYNPCSISKIDSFSKALIVPTHLFLRVANWSNVTDRTFVNQDSWLTLESAQFFILDREYTEVMQMYSFLPLYHLLCEHPPVDFCCWNKSILFSQSNHWVAQYHKVLKFIWLLHINLKQN